MARATVSEPEFQPPCDPERVPTMDGDPEIVGLVAELAAVRREAAPRPEPRR